MVIIVRIGRAEIEEEIHAEDTETYWIGLVGIH